MEAVDLAQVTVGDEVLAAIPRAVAETYCVLPLRFENGGRDLVIAAPEPHSIDALTDLGFMLSRRIVPVRADRDAIMAAIERHYVRNWPRTLHEMLRMIETLDSRGPVAVARDWLRRALWRRRLRLSRCDADLAYLSTCPPRVRFTNYLLLATAESGAREATVEASGGEGRFHFAAADGEAVEHDLPRKWARRIMRRLMEMNAGDRRRSRREGRFELTIRGTSFVYAAARERTADGERVVLRLVDQPSPGG
ncbi:MAG: GspE/PulE/PilB domain-containing protein [Planctomycetota bacterium]|jgi:type II secretory ATPase GspE/PulE/Tfp pilus assembly ATPase PilB-like protein